MKLETKYYEEAYENFTKYCSMWADRAVKYVPIHKHIIRVFLDDGDCVDFDNLSKTFRYIGKDKLESLEEMTEDDCRSIFARNLSDIMRVRGIGQATLSQRTGISQAMISKYLSKKSEPGISNIRKIARALECGVAELIDM